MFEEIKEHGKKVDRYGLMFVENGPADSMPESWTLNVLDYSNLEIIYSTRTTAAQAKWFKRREPHLQILYARTHEDWGIAHSMVEKFGEQRMEALRGRTASEPPPMPWKPKPILLKPGDKQ